MDLQLPITLTTALLLRDRTAAEIGAWNLCTFVGATFTRFYLLRNGKRYSLHMTMPSIVALADHVSLDEAVAKYNQFVALARATGIEQAVKEMCGAIYAHV